MDDRVEALLDLAARGELVADQVLAPADRGARRVLDALRARAGLSGSTPRLDELSVLAAEDPSAALAFAWLGARDALARMDAPGAAAFAAVARGIPARTARDAARLASTELWDHVLRCEDVAARATAAAACGRDAGAAEVVIEATAARALSALLLGEPAMALDHARRASRMAQSEQIPEAQYLAGWILSRARRASGRPHLAARILQGLRAVVPDRWHATLLLESMLASGETMTRNDANTTVSGAGPACELGRALAAAQALAMAPSEVAALAAGAGPLASDVRAWAELASEDLEGHAPDVRAWIDGSVAEVPRGLHGSVPDPSDAIGRVILCPPRWPRRTLAVGPVAEVRTLPRAGRRGAGRIDALIAACALPREPITYPELFRVVYGFSYRPELHRGVLDVALHRARAHLGDAATLSADDGHARFEAHAPLVLVDARCDRPEAERMLRVLGRRGRTTSRAIADELGMALRTVQALLSELEGEGACRAVTEGRAKEYILDDTTFAPPTATGRA